MIRPIIIDDEPLARSRLRKMLSGKEPQMDTDEHRFLIRVYRCSSVVSLCNT
jgi:hypothetical protein